ncbi:hypothetical protein [Streptomyces sp. NPDC046909]|uniref:hypothetical protein n=1 Tax=Streptomyces sp. NPDC046909 TaxID=3155617 RepID=UPI0033E76FAE
MEVVDAVAQFPTVIFASAVVVTLIFWLLVLLGRAGVRDFDADAPALARAFGEAPLAVSASVAAGSGWLTSLTGTLVMDHLDLTGLGAVLARITLLALSLVAAWSAARVLAGPLARAFSRSSRSHRRNLANAAPFDPGSRRARD